MLDTGHQPRHLSMTDGFEPYFFVGEVTESFTTQTKL
jgi:hypothetical protein